MVKKYPQEVDLFRVVETVWQLLTKRKMIGTYVFDETKAFSF